MVLPRSSRIFGSIEGATGIILMGWSTAFFFSIVDRLKLLEHGLERQLDRHPRAPRLRTIAYIPGVLAP